MAETINGMYVDSNFDNKSNNLEKLDDFLKIVDILTKREIGSFMTTDISFDKYNDSTYVFKYNGEELGYLDQNGYDAVINSLEEQIEADVIVNFTREQATDLGNQIIANPQSPTTSVDMPFIISHLGTYNFGTLLGMYNNLFTSDGHKKKIFNAMQAKIAQENFEQQIISLNSINETKNPDIYYETIVTILRNIPSDSQASEVVSKIGINKIQKAVKEYIRIDKKFASSFSYNYGFTPENRNYKVNVIADGLKAPEDLQNAGEVMAAYVLAMNENGGVRNLSGTARAIYQAFGSNLIQFEQGILPAMSAYSSLLPDPLIILGKKGIISGYGEAVDNILSRTNMTKSQKEGRKKAICIASAGMAIYLAVKLLLKYKWKGIFIGLGTLFVFELGSNMAGGSFFERIGKILYGAPDGNSPFSDSIKKTYLTGKELANRNENLKEEFAYLNFVNMFVGNQKMSNLKSFIKFRNGQANFDGQEYINSIPQGDWRRDILEQMSVAQVNQIFGSALNILGITNQTRFDRKKNTKFNNLVLQHQQITSKSVVGAYLVGNTKSSDNSSSSGNDTLQQNTNSVLNTNVSSEQTSVVDKNDQSLIVPEYVGDEGNFETFVENTHNIEIQCTGGLMCRVSEGGREYQITLPDTETFRQTLSYEGKQRFSLLQDTLDIWTYNFYKKIDGFWFVSQIQNRQMKQKVEEMSQKIAESKNSVFENDTEYNKLVRDIFDDYILELEKEKDFIDEDDALDVKNILLAFEPGRDLGNNTSYDATNEYRDSAIKIYNKMEKGWGPNDGDVYMIGEKLLDNIINDPSSDFGFIETFETSIIDKATNKTLVASDISDLMKSIKDENIAKILGININNAPDRKKKKIKEARSKINDDLVDIITKINNEMNKSEGSNLLDQGYDNLSDQQKAEITPEDFKRIQINTTFIRLAKHSVLSKLLDFADNRGEEGSYRLQYANFIGLSKTNTFYIEDIVYISPSNKEIVQEIGFTIATSFIPGGAAFVIASRLLLAAKLGRMAANGSKLAKIGIFLGSSSAGYVGTELLPSIGTGERTGSLEGYTEFMALSVILGSYGPIQGFLSGGKTSLSLKGIAAHLATTGLVAEASIVALQVLEDKDIEFSPGKWTQEEIATVIMILALTHIGNIAGLKKINVLKSKDGKINIKTDGVKQKVKYSMKNGELQKASWEVKSGPEKGKRTSEKIADGKEVITRTYKDSTNGKITEKVTIDPAGNKTIEVTTSGSSKTYSIQNGEFGKTSGNQTTYKFKEGNNSYEIIEVEVTTGSSTIYNYQVKQNNSIVLNGSNSNRFISNDSLIKLLDLLSKYPTTAKGVFGKVEARNFDILNGELNSALGSYISKSAQNEFNFGNIKIKKSGTNYELTKPGLSNPITNPKLGVLLKQIPSPDKFNFFQNIRRNNVGKSFNVGGKEYKMVQDGTSSRHKFQLKDSSGNFKDVKVNDIPKKDRMELFENIFGTRKLGSIGGTANIDSMSLSLRPLGMIFNAEVKELPSVIKNAFTGTAKVENLKKVLSFIITGTTKSFKDLSLLGKTGKVAGGVLITGLPLYSVTFTDTDWQEGLKEYGTNLGVYGVLNRFIGVLYALNEIDEGIGGDISIRLHDLLQDGGFVFNQDAIDWINDNPYIPNFAKRGINKYFTERDPRYIGSTGQ